MVVSALTTSMTIDSVLICSYLTRSQKRTYAIETAKNTMVTTTKITSCISISSCAPQNLTIKAKLSRFSSRTKSGVKPDTTDPGAPVFPPAGVIPFFPEKYGTFAAR
jgi:hypothetical protein